LVGGGRHCFRHVLEGGLAGLAGCVEIKHGGGDVGVELVGERVEGLGTAGLDVGGAGDVD